MTKGARAGQLSLAILPAASFAAQYALSRRIGTEHILLHHPTITFVDWIFVPFNFFVVRIIDWKKGAVIYVIVSVAVIFNIVVHAVWQAFALDPGHMITKNGIILPAGWVHLVFAILETTLLAAFVFCRKTSAPYVKVATVLAAFYFVTMGLAAYFIHNGLIVTDVAVWVIGLLLLFTYPKLTREVENERSR